MLKIRFVSAFIMIPIVIVATILGDLPFLVFALAGLLLSGWEYFAMARHAGHHPQPIVGLALITLMLLDAHFRWNLLREIVIGGGVVTMTLALFRRAEGWIVGWALTLVGALYLGGTGAYAVLLRASPNNGFWWTATLFLTNWASDAAAYFAGTRLGKHRFFPDVSPKKTREGAIGSWIASTIVGGLCALVFGLPILHGIVAGLGIGVAGAFGDLAESLVKRQFGAKDSGNLIPGHGGMLDRIDSFLFAAVFMYLYLVWFVRV
ncbi:MAG: phosphatidate cytidylyltransferase [Chloroflexi bacterium]|nr:phosphatidate cytidylyltransferase [Chloroflexota bacterium]